MGQGGEAKGETVTEGQLGSSDFPCTSGWHPEVMWENRPHHVTFLKLCKKLCQEASL